MRDLGARRRSMSQTLSFDGMVSRSRVFPPQAVGIGAAAALTATPRGVSTDGNKRCRGYS